MKRLFGISLFVAGLAACNSGAGNPADGVAVDSDAADGDDGAVDSDTAAADGNDVAVDSDTSAADGDDVAVGDDTANDVAVDSDSAADTSTITTRTLSLGGWTLQPGEETTRCMVVRLGNRDKIFVPRIRTTLSQGSHHFIVYRTNETEERTTPFECAPFTDVVGGGTVPLMITQTREETVELPPGVAFELEPNQMIRLEAHYLDYYPDPITTSAEVVFDVLPAGEAPLVADFLFYGTTSFLLPKHKETTTPWNYLQVPAGLQVFAMTGHTHALGTNVEVETATSAAAGTSVYPPAGRPFRWNDAPVAYFDPPLEFGEGEGFRFRCSWNNTTDGPVWFGESATAEMCFFWAYYYPSRGFLVQF